MAQPVVRAPNVHHLPGSPISMHRLGRNVLRFQVRARIESTPAKAGPFKFETAYLLAGSATAFVWIGCAFGALATYKPWRYTHNAVGVLEALSALPLIWACFYGLAAASREGWLRLRLPDCRRLNLGIAAASIWSAITVWFSPAFTSALVRTVDPVVYPLPLRMLAVLTHLCTALLCLSAWQGSVMNPSPARIVSGVLGSQWRISRSDDPDQGHYCRFRPFRTISHLHLTDLRPAPNFFHHVSCWSRSLTNALSQTPVPFPALIILRHDTPLNLCTHTLYTHAST